MLVLICRDTMGLPCDTYILAKDQLIYYSVTKCKYYPILLKNNDRMIMDFIEWVRDEQQYETFHNIVLYSLLNNTDKTIKIGSIGAIDADNIQSNGYCMVAF